MNVVKTHSFPFSTAGSHQMPKDAANTHLFLLNAEEYHSIPPNAERCCSFPPNAERCPSFSPNHTRCQKMPLVPAQCRNHRCCRSFPLKADGFRQSPLNAVFTTEIRRIPPISAQCRSSTLKAEGFCQWPFLAVQKRIIGRCHSVPFFTAESQKIPPAIISCHIAHALPLISARKSPTIG